MARHPIKAATPLNGAAGTMPLDIATWDLVAQELGLAPQHKRLVALLLQGKRDKQIAAELGIGHPTVRTYFGRIFQRVGVQDRVELILRVFAAARCHQKR